MPNHNALTNNERVTLMTLAVELSGWNYEDHYKKMVALITNSEVKKEKK